MSNFISALLAVPATCIQQNLLKFKKMLKSSFIFNIFNQHAVPNEMGYHTGLFYRIERLWMSCVWGGFGELECYYTVPPCLNSFFNIYQKYSAVYTFKISCECRSASVLHVSRTLQIKIILSVKTRASFGHFTIFSVRYLIKKNR